jgi:hypothetical protein
MLLIRAHQIASALYLTGESRISLKEAFSAGYRTHFLALGLHVAAYESRWENDGRIRLTSGRTLSDRKCLAEWERLFDLVELLGSHLREDRTDKGVDTVGAEARFISWSLSNLWKALQGEGYQLVPLNSWRF